MSRQSALFSVLEACHVARQIQVCNSLSRWTFPDGPRGNSVTHEDEMMKVASNQMDYETVTSLYTRSLALIKLAIGRA